MICAAWVGSRTIKTACCSHKRLNHPPYSPDLSPPNYFAFPMLKMELKGDRCVTMSGIQISITTKSKTIPITDFLQAMHRLEDRTNQCVAVNDGIISNKKTCLEFFEIFFGRYWSSVSKLGTHCVYQICNLYETLGTILMCFGSAHTKFQGYMFSTSKIRATCTRTQCLYAAFSKTRLLLQKFKICGYPRWKVPSD